VIKDYLVPTPLLWAGTPSTRPGFSKPHPTWPWTLPGRNLNTTLELLRFSHWPTGARVGAKFWCAAHGRGKQGWWEREEPSCLTASSANGWPRWLDFLWNL